MKNLIITTLLLLSCLSLKAQWTTIDMQNSPETTLFKHTGTSAPVPFNFQKFGYSGNSVSYGLLHLDMAHKTVGGGANLHFRLYNSANSFKEYGGFGAFITDNTSGSEDGALTFYTTFNGQHRTRQMTILSNGNVGIGTTSIPEKLSVNGNVNITGDLKMSGSDSYIWTNGTGTGYTGIWDQKNGRVLLYTSENSGSVGIGTNTPSEKLEIEAARPVISLKHPNDGTSAYGWIEFNDANSRLGYVGFGSSNTNHLYLYNEAGGNVAIPSGNLGIGTTSTGSHKLAVEGSIGAREIKVEASGWSDFVFERNYDLRTLEEVEEHINEKGHLPEIPSKAEVTENGINLGEMNAKLLQKIEELTLYLIDQNKQNLEQQKLIEQLQNEVSALKNK